MVPTVAALGLMPPHPVALIHVCVRLGGPPEVAPLGIEPVDMRSGGSGESAHVRTNEGSRHRSHDRSTRTFAPRRAPAARVVLVRRQRDLGLQRGELRGRDGLRGGLGELLGAGGATRQAGAPRGDREAARVPFDPEGVLEHLDAAHEVELDIVERAALALEERNAGLRRASG